MGGEKSRVLRGRTHGEFVHIGFADNDRATVLQFFDDGGIIRGDKVFQYFRGTGGPYSLGAHNVFEEYGDAGEGTSTIPGDKLVSFLRLFQRQFISHGNKGANFRVDLRDAFQVSPGQLNR